MLWIVLGLSVYVLFGFLLIRWAVGGLTLASSYPGDILCRGTLAILPSRLCSYALLPLDNAAADGRRQGLGQE